MRSWLYMLLLVAGVWGDMYLHNPRGSNNRLNENTSQRKNAARLFDSQNNDRGGYNVGDKTSKAADDEDDQYSMMYFQSSMRHKELKSDGGKTFLKIEWTNQHGCGVDSNDNTKEVNCDIILQYMCQPDTNDIKDNVIRNGDNTLTQAYTKPNKNEKNLQQASKRRGRKVKNDRGLHESIAYYDDCYIRERNEDLFTADQELQENNRDYSSAIHTRQNANGDRRGYECPEERDYYPYWHPNPWRDIAVLTNDDSKCSTLTDTHVYHRCFEYDSSGNLILDYSKYNTEDECNTNNGKWTEVLNYLEKAEISIEPEDSEVDKTLKCISKTKHGHKYVWAIPHDTTDGKTKECLVQLDQPECKQAPWSRTNHLGNGIANEHNSYQWTLPHFPSNTAQRCVLRARYNISTEDDMSQLENNPQVNVGNVNLQLAINTAQFGRTFQDRSHVFKLLPRTADMGNSRLYNLNVRGKRGNIVQTLPAVEYDFVPNDLQVKQNDLVHIQWTGSNTHNNKNDGDAGQGQGGTDRHNLVEIEKANVNYPLPLDETKLWKSTVVWPENQQNSDTLATNFATAGFGENMDKDMNKAPASYSGAVLKMTSKGTHHYMCSRNNAFTNRRQKGKITVE